MTAKLIQLNPSQPSGSLHDFFSTYGDKTGSTYAQFLDQVYQNYVKTMHYQYLSFSEKVNAEYQYRALRHFVLSLAEKQ